ncbi:MAG TPA: hypothetical protein VM427_10405 [Patescibacteria group bacterium]|nr:hypothetical protein [Patescibacteria group bacterium]
MTANIAPRTRHGASTRTAGSIEASSLGPSLVERPAPSFARSDAPAFVPRVVPGDSMTIGEVDQVVFDCPACSRPLAVGARRCPDCSAHLVNGVLLKKASVFVAVGLALGLVAGAGGGPLLGLGAPAVGPGTGPAAAGGPVVAGAASSARPSTAPSTPSGSIGDTPGSIPPATRAALLQTAGSNDRLTSARADLAGALAAATFDASDVARILRSVSADSVQAGQLATRIAAWRGSKGVGTRLAAFYDTIHVAAADSLVASVRNVGAYRAAATTMIGLLAGIAGVDTDIRTAAASLGVVIPAAAPAPTAP